MAHPILDAQRLRELLHYAPETGVFTWRVRRGPNGAKEGDVAGAYSYGYIIIKIDSRSYLAHRLAWFYVTGAWPRGEIDHRDGGRADNRWINLRDVTKNINHQNQRQAQAHNKSGLLGVAPNGKNWLAAIWYDGKQHYLGTYTTPAEAHAVYVQAKRRLHAGCTI